jgi:hypothetical protein
MHEILKPKTLKRKVKVVGPYDVTEGDVDPPECATCHCGCERQLCFVDLEGKGNQIFGIRGLE